MALNLTIDQGNSAAKMALWTQAPDNRCTDIRIIREHTADAIAELCNEFDISTAIFCSVSKPHNPVLSILRQRCRRVIELRHDTPTPLKIGYATPHTLGVDRLAAAVGAYTLPETHGRDILVVDIGTAITYDMVTADGKYCGGNIAPGIFMRVQALNRFTARLPMIDPDNGDVPLWGYNTETALRSGAINGVVAEVEYYRSKMKTGSAVIVTGGASCLINGRLPFAYTVVKNLTSIGLNSIINYNEKI